MRNAAGQFVAGNVPWHKGRRGVYRQEALDRMSAAKFKGDSVGYVALHEWIRKVKGRTGKCEWCPRENVWTDMANLSGDYFREVEDWVELCRKCHWRFDHGR